MNILRSGQPIGLHSDVLKLHKSDVCGWQGRCSSITQTSGARGRSPCLLVVICNMTGSGNELS